MLSISLKILADLVAAAVAGTRVSADIRTRSQPIHHVGGGARGISRPYLHPAGTGSVPTTVHERSSSAERSHWVGRWH